MTADSQKGLGEKAAGAMFWNFIGKFYFMAAKYAESIILLRMLGAEEYGAFGAVMGAHTMAVMFASLGLGNAVLKFLPQVRESGGDERGFFLKILWLRVMFAAIAAGVLIAFAPYFAKQFLHDETRSAVFCAAGLLVFGTAMQNVLARVLVSHYKQKTLNLIQAVVETAYLALAVIAIAFGGGVRVVLFMYAAAMIGGAAAMWIKSKDGLKRAEKANAKKPEMRRLAGFAANFFLYDILNFVLERPLDVLMIGLLHPDLKQVAYYVLAYNFAVFSFSIFTKVFAEGFTLSMVADLFAAKDYVRLRKAYGAVVEYMYLFIIPVAVGGLVIGDDLIRVMYGSEGRGAVGPALFFLVVMALGKYQGVSANFLGAMDKERALIVSRSIFAVLNIILNFILIPLYGAWGAVIATSAATLAGLVYESVLLHKALSPNYPGAFFAKVACASAIMGGVVYFLCGILPDSDWARVLVGLPAGAAVYGLGLIALKPINPELLDILKKTKLPGARKVAALMTPRKSWR